MIPPSVGERVGGPAAAHARQHKGCDQVVPPRWGARKSVPEGHSKVAHYEVVGKRR